VRCEEINAAVGKEEGSLLGQAVPRGPPIWIWILVFPKITKEFLYFILLEKTNF